MQLTELGKLSFETDISEYFPEGFFTKLQYEDKTITMVSYTEERIINIKVDTKTYLNTIHLVGV